MSFWLMSVLTFEFVDIIIKCDHSESKLISLSSLHYIIQPQLKLSSRIYPLRFIIYATHKLDSGHR